MSDGGVLRHATAEAASGRSRSSSAMAEMFLPLDRLLGCDQQIAAPPCLVGQAVALGESVAHPVAALRICAGARFVTEAWSRDGEAADANVRRELERVGAVVSKIEWLLAHLGDLPAGATFPGRPLAGLTVELRSGALGNR